MFVFFLNIFVFPEGVRLVSFRRDGGARVLEVKKENNDRRE